MYSNPINNKPIPLNELKEELNYTNTETMHDIYCIFYRLLHRLVLYQY